MDIRFIDTSLRDGDQSLWGFRLKTGMILPVAEQIDRAGFEAVEPDVMINFKRRLRDLHEEPWERLNQLSKRITRTPLSMMAGTGGSTFQAVPIIFNKLRLERLAAHGVKRVQIVGYLNDMDFRMPETVGYAREAGLQVVVGITYTISPKHTDEYYARKTRDALKLKPDRLFLKDPGGLLTPERTKTLIPAILNNGSGLPVELHSHCTTGLAPLCYLEAIKLGITTLQTGIPPLANGAAQPSVLNVARNARLLGYNPLINEDALKPVSDHFYLVAKREGFPVGAPVEYDYGQYLHQVPGGVIANLVRQLKEMGMPEKLAAVKEESIQVRKDLGYPIMITPFSQHVVTQATINVILGERYKEVTDELIQYCLGNWGQEAISGVEAPIKAKILDRPRGRELARQVRHEPSYKEFCSKLGGPGVSDDELVLRYMMDGEQELKAARPALPVTEYLTSSPVVSLVRQALKQKDLHHISIVKKDLRLTLDRKN